MGSKIGMVAAAGAAVLFAQSASAATFVRVVLKGNVYEIAADANPIAVEAAFPIGTPVTANFLVDTSSFGTTEASGSIAFGSVVYSVTSGAFNGGINVDGQSYRFSDLVLSGPSIPADTDEYLPGIVGFDYGLPFPNPLEGNLANYPNTAIFIVYPQSGGNGFNIDRAKVRLTFSSVTAVPEPASWAMLVVGFGLVGAGMRRPRATLPEPAPLAV